MSESELRDVIVEYATPDSGFCFIEDVMKAINDYCTAQCAAMRKEDRNNLVDALRTSLASTPSKVGEVLAIYDHFTSKPAPQSKEENDAAAQ